MKPRLFTLACLVALFPCVASASLTPPPSWTVSSGKAAEGNSGYAPTGKLPLVVQSSENAALPIECVFRFRAATGGVATFQATQADEKTPLLSISFSRGPGDYIGIGALSSGRKMATDAMSTRRWFSKTVPTGGVAYHWRFDYVRNLWDDRDRAEIGSDYARLTPFNDKTFVVRLVVTPEYRQAWIDDRLIAEDRVESRGPVRFAMQIRAGATVVSETIQNSEAYGRFIPLRLDDYESDGREQPEGQVVKHSTNGQEVPLRSLAPQARDIDLGKSLWRYRLTHGTGPDAPYVNGMRSWPTPLQVDPDTASFRVPYRDYQNVWLVAWMDEKPCAVPRGTVSFFREQAGYVARSDFEVTPEAMSKGLVTRLGKDGEGRQLYLIRVPLDTEGLYRFIDMAGQFLDFQVTKPTYLVRSYPDPIYYGYHPGGEPSSIHVVSITMEESPFGFEVKPAQYGHVFEQPEKPDYKVAVANHTADPLNASVRLDTTSFDGKEQTHSEASVTVKPGETSDAALSLHLHTLGWHQLKATVTADGVVRTCTLSLMILPPNTRTYGNAANETRFGAWFLAGHYIPLTTDLAANEPILALMHKMGIRRMGFHPSMVDPAMAKKYDLIPTGPHTTEMVYHTLKENDPVQFEKMLQVELGVMQGTQKLWPTPMYYYGGEWGFDANYSHAPNSRYVGKGPNVFSDVSKARLDRQIKIFTGIGRVLREKTPGVKLAMQWGSPYHEVAFMDAGFPKDLVDYFGIDAPIFELTPETPLGVGSINYLWTVRAEAKRLGWPRLPMAWCEGPFLPSWEGALTGSEQAQNYVRLWLVGMAYGVEAFEAGVVPFDTTNYYGAEHYGAGVFEGIPRECPKPAAAALATATSMVCGADVVGPVDTGVLTTYCLAFKHATTGKMTYALWRVNGTVEATISVAGDSAVVTDSMGNPRTIAAKDGKISVEISPSPVWLTGISGVKGFAFGAPTYTEKPAKITRPLPAFAAGNWAYSGSEDSSYENNHFGIVRVTDPKLGATFTPGEDGHADAAEVMLGLEPAGDSPMAARYGQLVLKKPVVIPGKATALGVWVKGNSGWGRIAFQIRDAKGELWTSIGTPNEWNCDDTYGWSRVSFEGWRYIRFPLPGNRPYDAARELDTTWWKSEKGDGIVDLPVRLERVFVEASNETIDLGEMKIVPDRTYKLAGMVAEYASDADASDAVLAKYQYQPIPTWEGPAVNPLAALKTQGEGQAPDIKAFTEPGHFNDGRQMVVRFDQAPGNKYNLYLSRYADGRGAERLPGNFTDNSLVTGLRPGIEMYLFLTTTGANGKESKPSAPFKLVTEDRFAEK